MVASSSVMSRDTAALTPKGITATTGRSADRGAAKAAPESIHTAVKSPITHRSMKPASSCFFYYIIESPFWTTMKRKLKNG